MATTFKERVKSVSLIFACVFLHFLDLIPSIEDLYSTDVALPCSPMVRTNLGVINLQMLIDSILEQVMLMASSGMVRSASN